jgi:hypothetical protein
MLRDGAMGIVVGYFVPSEEAPLAKLHHEAKGGTTAMSHEHAER